MALDPGTLVDEAAWQAAGALAGEVLRDDDELRAVCTGLHDAEWNGVHRARPRPGTSPAELVARATTLFAGRPFIWHLGADSDPAVEAAVADLPFVEEEPGMVAVLFDAVVAAPVPPTGVDLVDVVTDGQLRTWVEVLTGGQGHEGLAAVRRPAALGGPAPHVLAVAGGRPVGCAAVFLTEVAAVVDHVVTARHAQRRGIGTLLTRWALTTAQRAGHRTAVLTASPQGRRIHERLGSQTVSTIRRYRSSPGRPATGPRTADRGACTHHAGELLLLALAPALEPVARWTIGRPPRRSPVGPGPAPCATLRLGIVTCDRAARRSSGDRRAPLCYRPLRDVRGRRYGAAPPSPHTGGPSLSEAAMLNPTGRVPSPTRRLGGVSIGGAPAMTASVVPGLLLHLVMPWLTWALAALDAQLLRGLLR